MAMTEGAAACMVCPMMSRAGVVTSVSGELTGTQLHTVFCHGSRCAAWQWIDGHVGDPKSKEGRCGLTNVGKAS